MSASRGVGEPSNDRLGGGEIGHQEPDGEAITMYADLDRYPDRGSGAVGQFARERCRLPAEP